jgi:hypothetical protein
MNTLIGSIASLSFGQVRTLLLRVEELPLSNLNPMLRNKAVLIADFGGIEPHSTSPPIPHHRQSEYRCGGSTPEI